MKYITKQGREYSVTNEGASPLFMGASFVFPLITPRLANWQEELEHADSKLRYDRMSGQYQ